MPPCSWAEAIAMPPKSMALSLSLASPASPPVRCWKSYINGAMEYDLVGEPLLMETFSSSKSDKGKTGKKDKTGKNGVQDLSQNVPNITLS